MPAPTQRPPRERPPTDVAGIRRRGCACECVGPAATAYGPDNSAHAEPNQQQNHAKLEKLRRDHRMRVNAQQEQQAAAASSVSVGPVPSTPEQAAFALPALAVLRVAKPRDDRLQRVPDTSSAPKPALREVRPGDAPQRPSQARVLNDPVSGEKRQRPRAESSVVRPWGDRRFDGLSGRSGR